MSIFSKLAKTVTSTTSKVVKTSVKAVPAVAKAVTKKDTYTDIGKGVVAAGKGTVKIAGQAQNVVNKQIENTVVGQLGIVKKGLGAVGLNSSFFGPLGTFLKYLPYLAVLSVLGWFLIEWRKGNSRVIIG
jgi:hypothetical protein